MLSDTIITSDLHLTANPRDDHRWGLFPWLVKQAEALGTRNLLILGDITDAKDNHSAVLVNSIVDALKHFTERQINVTILRGNHDGLDPAWPFFRFLNKLPGTRFIANVTRDGGSLFLPHSRDPVADWADVDMAVYANVFAHATVTGAEAETGVLLNGTPRELLAGAKHVFSGDVHVPQTVGNVEYVGAPYPIRFGDKFRPRCIVFRKEKRLPDIHFPCLRRRTLHVSNVAGITDAGLDRGDQIKVRLTLQQADVMDWEKHRAGIVEVCRDLGVDLCGLELTMDCAGNSPATRVETPHTGAVDLFDEFCIREKLGLDLTELGKTFTEDH